MHDDDGAIGVLAQSGFHRGDIDRLAPFDRDRVDGDVHGLGDRGETLTELTMLDYEDPMARSGHVDERSLHNAGSGARKEQDAVRRA